MHPADVTYFRNYARHAREAGQSLEDYYVTIQRLTHRDPYQKRTNLVPQKLIGLKLARSYMRPDESLLVVGGGVGFEVEWFRQQGMSDVAVLDMSVDRLRVCRQWYGVPTVCGDMKNTGLKERSFDHVLTRQSLHHVFYPYQTLQELARIADRSVMIVSEPVRTWFKQTYRTLLGHRVISKANIYEYQFALSDVDRYMAFFGFELVGRKVHLEHARFGHQLHQILSACVPFLRNRFSAVYRRM